MSQQAYLEHISKEEINLLPENYFRGEIVIVENLEEIAHVLEEVNKYAVVGFDTESKPAFKKGTFNNVALVQIALDHKVFLIRTCKTGSTDALAAFFANDKIRKIGVALHDDIKDLRKLKDFTPGGFIDLQKFVGKAGIGDLGLKNITAIVLGFRISKKMQVTNWEQETLNEQQIRYAATDAWVGLEIYKELYKSGMF